MRDDGDPEGLLDLIRRAAGGDRRAFDRLVVVKRERVVRTAYQVTGDLEDARDVAQSVFLRLWHVLPRFDPGQRFDTWLYRITVNAAIDLLRSRGPKGMLQPLPDDPSVLGVDEAAQVDLDAALDLRDVQRAFMHLAARLSPKQRAAFVLKEIEGLETAEVARILDVTESTVRNHLLQARRTLRAGLEREYPSLCPPARRKGGSE
jgi:RNA polymerase sigma-70 factor (ECF subfamily)